MTLDNGTATDYGSTTSTDFYSIVMPAEPTPEVSTHCTPCGGYRQHYHWFGLPNEGVKGSLRLTCVTCGHSLEFTLKAE